MAITQDFITRRGIVVEGTNIVTGATGNTGALQVNSGAAIAKNTVIGTSLAVGTTLAVAGSSALSGTVSITAVASSTSTVTANALYVAGGVGIAGSMVVSGAAVFKDSVTFNGATTTVSSTNTVYTDNIIELHAPPTSAWTVSDGKDIGIRMHYYNGGDQNAFFGRVNNTGYLEYFNTGAEGATTFAGATYGGIKAGAFYAADATASISATTGALQVAGGAGIGGAIYVGANVSGGTVSARNLTTGRVVFSNATQLTDDTGLSYNTVTGVLTTIASRALLCDDLIGGTSGGMAYQSGVNATTFLPIGLNGYVLSSNGTLPVWSPLSGLSAGTATTATNIANGLAGQIPFQTAAGSTGFSANLLYTAATSTLSSPTISAAGTTPSTSVTTGALTVAGGAGISGAVFVGSAITVGTPVTATVVPAIISNVMAMSSYTKTGITGITLTALDTFSSTVYRSARYSIQIVDGTSVHITEMGIFHDGVNVYISEYGVMTTPSGELGVFDAAISGGVLTLSFTPVSATSMTIKLIRMSITL